MRKIDFNRGWTVRCLTRDEGERLVNLPHDAMIGEDRSDTSLGADNIGYFVGGDYEYVKSFDVPESWEGRTAIFEFEGVYHNAEVWLGGEKLHFRPYGYTNFYVDVTDHLKLGEANELKVIARNEDQPNSRWYPGTGIYRPVSLWVADGRHVVLNGVRIRTLDHEAGTIEVKVATSEPGPVRVEVLDGDAVVLAADADATDGTAALTLTVPNAKLWSCEDPNLYVARVTAGDDVVEETFGIRTLAWSTKTGMTINGERVILRGCCVHHDNGILGACAFPEAEERKVRLMKQYGYNALRSSHNPCSKAMLDACDRLGMLMMDEFADAWTIHKTAHDYVDYLKDWWQADLTDMVEKDYNHPSVIMYSTGNEVAETSTPEGIEFTGEMTRFLHSLDDTRPVTCGINIFFNLLYSLGFGQYSDEKAAAQAESVGSGKKRNAVGSEFYNQMACLMGDKFMKFGATLHMCDVKTRDAYANMDIAGYNYGIWRYDKDSRKYPNRLILGSETFCKDTWLFMDKAKDNPQVIGDFVWAGMDYIGECGMGATEYDGYTPPEEQTHMTGHNGRVDLIGRPRAEAAYTMSAFGLLDGPRIGVWPLGETGKPDITGWALTRAFESWAWAGHEGERTTVEIYSRADQVELRVNDRCIARKKADKTGRTLFKNVKWVPGTVTAIAYDHAGNECGRHSLVSDEPGELLALTPEEQCVRPEGLTFVLLQLTDPAGTLKPLARHRVRVEVENGELVGLGSACTYLPLDDNYTDDVTDTYYGEAMAVVRATGEGDVRVSAKALDAVLQGEVTIPLGEALPKKYEEI